MFKISKRATDSYLNVSIRELHGNYSGITRELLGNYSGTTVEQTGAIPGIPSIYKYKPQQKKNNQVILISAA